MRYAAGKPRDCPKRCGCFNTFSVGIHPSLWTSAEIYLTPIVFAPVRLLIYRLTI
ncbi:MAG: hypothetical protein AW09_002745 [Candidatus Accumulibacter phosphatis]|uniref:Uncharacterized protein n=1 Tax=Candidatus Accumulibacter phosphatis TaxID=327160 RepID=A0A080LU54_9PROT|nr:MAG: hypothetical protein AW09_002745 [Candidatus Accumulibacter phosphatis]